MITEDDVTGTETSTKWQTKDGRAVKIDALGVERVYGSIEYGGGSLPWSWWRSSGRTIHTYDDGKSLIPIPEKREPLVGWVVIEDDDPAVSTFWTIKDCAHVEAENVGGRVVPVREYRPEDVLQEFVVRDFDGDNAIIRIQPQDCPVRVTVTRAESDHD